MLTEDQTSHEIIAGFFDELSHQDLDSALPEWLAEALVERLEKNGFFVERVFWPEADNAD